MNCLMDWSQYLTDLMSDSIVIPRHLLYCVPPEDASENDGSLDEDFAKQFQPSTLAGIPRNRNVQLNKFFPISQSFVLYAASEILSCIKYWAF